MNQTVGRRRRGAALEAAILDAAWEELVNHTYGSFTMQAVAKRAGTSRPVLARRWESRSDLAVAAIAQYHQNNPVEAPDLGNVRDDLVALLQRFSDRGARTMINVLLNMSRYFLENNSNITSLRQQVVGDGRMNEVLERGVKRGELDKTKLTPRISALPIDLVGHELIITRRPVSEKVIEEIIDFVFLPLVTRIKS